METIVKLISVILGTIVSVVFSFGSHAAAPTCHLWNSQPYCNYVGKVQQIYVNSGNLVLLYFDTPMAEGMPESVGITNIRNRNAAAFSIS